MNGVGRRAPGARQLDAGFDLRDIIASTSDVSTLLAIKEFAPAYLDDERFLVAWSCVECGLIRTTEPA